MRNKVARSLKGIALAKFGPTKWRAAYKKMKKAWSSMNDDEKKKMLKTLVVE